ncbi:hypothetical protein TruAng_001978 [Truncatella angustata]|nr:hypothetical protein TruAng_001978 [Truncatella angustata]
MTEQPPVDIGPDGITEPAAASQPSSADPQLPQTQHSDTNKQSSTQSYRLSPQTEDGIKAAVTAAMPAQNLDPIRWMIYKSMLRGTSLTLCILIVVGELLVAILSWDRGAIDTATGIPSKAVLLGIWDTWRIVQLRRGRGPESFSKMLMVGEGLAMVTGLALCFGLAYAVSINPWYGLGARYGILMIGVIIVTCIHITLFSRFCSEKIRGTDLYGDGSIDLPNYSDQPQAQPAQIIVQYVHTCSKCGNHTEPKPGEVLNEVLAARGEMQPQNFSPAEFRHIH